MTAPQFPAGWAQPAAPAAPAPQFGQAPVPQAPNPYTGQQPFNAYGNPAAYAPQPNPYAQYPQAAPAQPDFTPAGGTLDDYVNQRAAGAKFWKFPQVGHVNVGMIPRELRDTDVQQVSFNGQPVRRKDGSISTEKALYLPLADAEGSEWVWEVKSRNRDLLTAAVQAQGVASGIPEKGGMLRVQLVNKEQVPGTAVMRNVMDVQYARPNGVGVPVPAPAPQQAPAPAPQQAPAQYAQPVPQAAPAPQPVQQAPAPQPTPAAPAPAQYAQPRTAAPQLSAEAAAQFQNMLGAAAPQQQ